MRNPSVPAGTGPVSAMLQADRLAGFEVGLDPLTSLYSPALFHELGETRFSEARRHGFQAAIMLVDIDEFARIRATHGTLVGDAVMIHVSELLRGVLRREDMIALGDDSTFQILLMHCDGENAMAKAEALRAAIATLDPAGVTVTVSIGVGAGSVKEGMRLSALIGRADRALTVARTGGRNRVVYDTGVAHAGQRAPVPVN